MPRQPKTYLVRLQMTTLQPKTYPVQLQMTALQLGKMALYAKCRRDEADTKEWHDMWALVFDACGGQVSCDRLIRQYLSKGLTSRNGRDRPIG